MIPYKIFSAIHLGPVAIQPWGIMVALGFLAAIYIAVKEAKRKKEDANKIYDLIFYILFSSINIIYYGLFCKECGYPVVKIIRKGKRPLMFCVNKSCKLKEKYFEEQQKEAKSKKSQKK